MIAVEFDKASELNEWLRLTMVRDLERRGYEIRDDADLVLRFRSQLRSDQDSGSRFSMQAESGIERHDSFRLDYSVPLGERPGIGSSTFFSITATAGRRGKQALWQGSASAKARHRRAVEPGTEGHTVVPRDSHVVPLGAREVNDGFGNTRCEAAGAVVFAGRTEEQHDVAATA